MEVYTKILQEEKKFTMIVQEGKKFRVAGGYTSDKI